MNRVFRDNQLEEEFDKKGVVKIQLLNEEEIRDLKEFDSKQIKNERFNTHNGNDTDVSFHFTFLDSNSKLKNGVFEKISELMQPKMDALLCNYEPLVVNYVNKEPNCGEVPVHGNWNFVNEKDFYSVSIWCPLVDIGLNSGGLEFVEGSHKLYRNEVLRSPSLRAYFFNYIEELKENYLKPVTLKAGEALIFCDSILHYSKANRADYDRLAIQVIAKPREAQRKHYYFHKSLFSSKVEELDVNTEFYFNFKFSITERPNMVGVTNSKKRKYKLPKISLKNFKSDYADYKAKYLTI